MNSSEILNLLADKHHEDVFVSECKNGPTWGGTHFRLDAWVMNRSWARLCMTGYEIKVSRSDFLNDKKMHEYLPLCHQLYVAAPKGIVHDNELPPEIGLMEVASTGNRLLTRKKAHHRTIDPPAELLIYILMCRSKITWDRTSQNPVEMWKEWLRKRDEEKEIGYQVARKIRERVTQIEVENIRLRKENDGFQEVKKLLERLGINSGWFDAWTIERKLKDFQKLIPEDFADSLNRLSGSISRMQTEMNKLSKAA